MTNPTDETKYVDTDSITEGNNPFAPVPAEASQGELVSTDDLIKVNEVSPTIFEKPSEVFFSSIPNDGTRENALKLYTAINDPEQGLSDIIGTVIEVEHMVAHTITLKDEETEKDVEALRVILVTKDGTGYSAVSAGIVSSLQKVIALFGPAPWSPALKMVPVQKKTRNGVNKVLSLRITE